MALRRPICVDFREGGKHKTSPTNGERHNALTAFATELLDEIDRFRKHDATPKTTWKWPGNTHIWKYDAISTPFRRRVVFSKSIYNMNYNIAFVNSERWLAKSRVDITLCQHGKFPATLLLKKKYKTFFPYWYTVISTLVKIGKTRNCVKTLHPAGVVFPHNFSFFQFPLVLI